MLKYSGDLIEKLVAGALVVGLFQNKAPAVIAGFILLGLWVIIRREETFKSRRNGK